MFILALVLGAVTGAPQDARVAWNWDADTQVCALKQEVAEGGQTIEISQTPANNETRISLTMEPPAHVRDGRFKGFIQLDSGEKTSADVYERRDGGKLHIYAVTEDRSFVRKFADTQSVQISHDDVVRPQLSVQSPSTAAYALEQCEDQKMREWGMDLAAWHALKSPPIPIGSLTDRFSALDYPMNALTFLVTGDAVTRLDIGADGSVKQCRSLNASKYKGFDYATCEVLKGARFEPALNAAGEAVAAPYVIDVSFRIGG